MMRVMAPGDRAARHALKFTGFGVGVGGRAENLALIATFASTLAP